MSEDEESRRERCALVIQVVNGVYDGMEQDFDSLPVTVGRSGENNIAIPFDTAASRSHAKLIKGELRHSLVIIDLNSTNGTFVNYMMIKDRADVKSGDVIKVGDTLIKCTIP
jgi:pSer/pThr/pTyr-binding forkhead associated (FHA) protein